MLLLPNPEVVSLDGVISLETERPDGGNSGSRKAKTSCGTATDLDLPSERKVLLI